MLKEMIEKILSLAAIEQFNINGRQYTSARIVPVAEPTPPVLSVNTLQGLVDYLQSGFDQHEIGTFAQPGEVTTIPPQLALQIVSPREVVAFAAIDEPWKDRHVYVRATWNREPFPFGKWHGQEAFVIMMQAMFLPSVSWQPVMDIAGKIVCEDQAEIIDDGVAQAATVRRGIRQQSGIILPNPVTLRPVRTFTEVEQPESLFVFRMRSDPRIELSLHEADMGAWEFAAKENIKKYLEGQLPGVPIFM